MATLEARCLDAFPNWLRSLADDARALASVLEADAPDTAQRRSAAALNYLFKSLDLIPDGLEDLGFIDDAFVVRAAAESVKLESEGSLAADSTGTLARLAEEADTSMGSKKAPPAAAPSAPFSVTLPCAPTSSARSKSGQMDMQCRASRGMSEIW
jgi:uncharacterized membrane protein YkvA (DUF1232 family)